MLGSLADAVDAVGEECPLFSNSNTSVGTSGPLVNVLRRVSAAASSEWRAANAEARAPPAGGGDSSVGRGEERHARRRQPNATPPLGAIDEQSSRTSDANGNDLEMTADDATTPWLPSTDASLPSPPAWDQPAGGAPQGQVAAARRCHGQGLHWPPAGGWLPSQF